MTAWAVEDLVAAPVPPAQRSWAVVFGAALSLVLHGALLMFVMLPADADRQSDTPSWPTTEVTWLEVSPSAEQTSNPRVLAAANDKVSTAPPSRAPTASATRPASTQAEPRDQTNELTQAALVPEATASAAGAPGNPLAPFATADTLPSGDGAEAQSDPTAIGVDTTTEAASQAYVWNVLGHLQPFQNYPRAAQRRGHEGTVLVRARVSRKGVVLRAEIREGSGHRSLDEAALALLAKASPLPPPPPGPTAITELDLPIVYGLRTR